MMDFAALRLETSGPGTSPPAGVREIVGEITHVYESVKPQFGTTRSARNPAHSAGIRYESRAIEHLQRAFAGRETRAGQWMGFRDLSGQRSCQPDFFVLDADKVILFEIKLSHCSLAWYQLNALYAPVLHALYRRTVICVEMCKSFDPGVSWPEAPPRPILSMQKLRPALGFGLDATLVYRWKPRAGGEPGHAD